MKCPLVEEFPYPIALTYRRMLETPDAAERAHHALHVFHFTVRVVAFTTVLQYINTPPSVLYDAKLNASIEEKLKQPFTGDRTLL